MAEAPDNLDDALRSNASGPRRARGDSAEIEQHPSTADYFTVNDDGDVVDPVTGEIRESTASAA